MKRVLILLMLVGCSAPSNRMTDKTNPTDKTKININEDDLIKKLQAKTVESVNGTVDKASKDGELFTKGTRLFGGKLEVSDVKVNGGKRVVTLCNVSSDKLEIQIRFRYFNTDWKREIITDNSRVYKDYSLTLKQAMTLESVDMSLIDATEIRLEIKSK